MEKLHHPILKNRTSGKKWPLMECFWRTERSRQKKRFSFKPCQAQEIQKSINQLMIASINKYIFLLPWFYIASSSKLKADESSVSSEEAEIKTLDFSSYTFKKYCWLELWACGCLKKFHKYSIYALSIFKPFEQNSSLTDSVQDCWSKLVILRQLCSEYVHHRFCSCLCAPTQPSPL